MTGSGAAAPHVGSGRDRPLGSVAPLYAMTGDAHGGRNRRGRCGPDRRLTCIKPIAVYKDLLPILGREIKTDVSREQWDEILPLVTSLRAATVLLSAMLKRVAAYQRQNQLDPALQELGCIERTLFKYICYLEPVWARCRVLWAAACRLLRRWESAGLSWPMSPLHSRGYVFDRTSVSPRARSRMFHPPTKNSRSTGTCIAVARLLVSEAMPMMASRCMC